MATAPSPPILIWSPGGGFPGGPVSNPPVYSQKGTTQLIVGQSYIDVVFGSTQTMSDWVLGTCEIENTTDLNPLNIWPGIITSRTTSGFRLQLNGLPDTWNYYLHWAVSGVNITPSPAIAYLFSGPTTGAGDTPETFTVSLPPSTTVAAIVTITPNDGGLGGIFTPASVQLSTGSASATFTYSPVSYGARTLSVTNSSTLIDPAPITFTVTHPTYTFIGPTSGNVGVASTDFTVALVGAAIGTVTVTPSSGGGGGTFTPTTVTISTGAPSVTFTYTPASAGTKTISVTNGGGLANPGSISYVATAPFSPTDIAGLKLWLKADSLALSDGASVASWTDSSGSGNTVAQATGANQPIYKTAIVNGKPVVRFDGVNDYLSLAAELTTLSDYSLFIVYQTSGDNCMVGATTVNQQIIRIGDSGNNRYSTSDGVSPVNSDTLGLARTAWNLGLLRRGSGTVIWFERGIYRNSGGGGFSRVGSIGSLGISPTAIPTNGDIAEVLLYDTALSNADINSVQNYLGTKYALTITPLLLRDIMDRIT